MDYKCFNCEENIELDETIEDVDCKLACPFCNSLLNLDIYSVCSNCKVQYIYTFNSCPVCNKTQNNDVVIPGLNYIYVNTSDQYNDAINFFDSSEILGVDTEGNSLDPYKNELLLIQVGNEEIVYIFNYRWHKKLAGEKFWNEKLLIFHNAKFDYKVLKYSLQIELNMIFDTFLAERILTCGIERRNSLKEVAEKYLGVKMDKEVRSDFINMTLLNFDDKINKQHIKYAARDVQLLPIIYRKQKWELENGKLAQVAELEFQIAKIVGNMELRGIYLDTLRWRKIIDKCERMKMKIEDDIHNLLIDIGYDLNLLNQLNINLNSTKVLKDIFGKLGITIETTGDAALAEIKHPFAEKLREYRKYEKQISSFGESFLKLINDKTKRIHPSFQQIGADTGRFSCNKPNLQQIPSDDSYRECFRAPKGRKIIACDYSQQELRLLASLSKDPKFIQFYKDGVDLHSATASMMFNIPIEKVEKEHHRKIAKTINFGLAYGQGAKKLGITIGVSEDEATKMIDKYFSQFTYIRDWLEKAAKKALDDGYSTTLLGRKRFYRIPNTYDNEYKQIMSSIGRRGKNTPIQGSGVDMIKNAMVLIAKRLEVAKLDAFLVNIVHDELIVESSDQDAKTAAQIVKESMEEAGRSLAPNVPIVAEVGIGDWWKH